MDTYDVVVIGAGPGGYPAAIRAARNGARTAIVEREAWGGTCLNWGCIPTKTLIAAGYLLHQVKQAGPLGIEAEGLHLDYPRLLEHKSGVIRKLAGGVEALLRANKVDMLRGAASFVTARQLLVSGPEGERRIGAGRVIVATGSVSAVPGFLPKHERVVESRAFLDLPALPPRLLVMGGGYIGCELACLAAQLGAEVTIVEMLDDILLLLDDDARREVRRHMESDLGIRILTGSGLEAVTADEASVRGRVGETAVEADLLLVAVGRRPEITGLHPGRAGLEPDERGYLRADEFNRTAVPGIYAIGDVNGGPQLAHAAHAQGLVAADHACGRRTPKNETLIPGVIFTSPEVAVAGLSETAAKEANRAVRVGRFQYAALGRAMAANETAGFVKWIADARTDQLLGAQAVGAHATDLISEAMVAIRNELTAAEIGRTVHPHPTFGELWMEAAHAVHGECIHAPPPKHH
jgi:dihydrolipoamide dehydrogenase